MPAIAPERWPELSRYLDKALEIPPEERAVWLKLLREENPSLALLSASRPRASIALALLQQRRDWS